MRRTIAIAWLHWKALFLSPAAIVLMFVMPIMFSIIFGGMGSAGPSSKKPVVLIVSAKNNSNQEILKLLTKNEQYQWKETSVKEAKELVRSQKAIAAVKLATPLMEERLDHGPVFEIIIQRKTQEYEALRRYLEGAGKTAAQSAQLAAEWDSGNFETILKEVNNREPITINRSVIQKDKNNTQSISMLAIGFTIMFMMFGISGAASTILDERIGGTWQRLFATPASKLQIMSGYLLSYFLMGWTQLAVLMGTIKLVYGAGWGRLSYFIPFASLVIVTIIGFGLMLASLVKTRQQAGALGAVLIVSTCMLGGVYWPLDIVPDFMQLLGKMVPQSWMIAGFKEIISGSLYLPVILTSTAVLGGFTAAFFLVGLKKIKYN